MLCCACIRWCLKACCHVPAHAAPAEELQAVLQFGLSASGDGGGGGDGDVSSLRGLLADPAPTVFGAQVRGLAVCGGRDGSVRSKQAFHTSVLHPSAGWQALLFPPTATACPAGFHQSCRRRCRRCSRRRRFRSGLSAARHLFTCLSASHVWLLMRLKRRRTCSSSSCKILRVSCRCSTIQLCVVLIRSDGSQHALVNNMRSAVRHTVCVNADAGTMYKCSGCHVPRRVCRLCCQTLSAATQPPMLLHCHPTDSGAFLPALRVVHSAFVSAGLLEDA